MKTAYRNISPEYKLQLTGGRTHPIVLIAAAGLTIFSILGSAAITGLIPVNHQGKGELGGILSERAVILPLPSPEMSRAGIKQNESSYERTSESATPSESKEFVKSSVTKTLVLG